MSRAWGRGVGLGGGVGLGFTEGVLRYLRDLRKLWGYMILREAWISNFASYWNWG